MAKPTPHPARRASFPPVDNSVEIRGGQAETDPILALRGTGKALWADEDADAYVERLRYGSGGAARRQPRRRRYHLAGGAA